VVRVSLQAEDRPNEPARGGRVLPGRRRPAVAGALGSPAHTHGSTQLSVVLGTEQPRRAAWPVEISLINLPTLVAGHGNDGAQRPKDREDAEHARHGATLGFRSHNWQLRLSAALACRGYVPGVRVVAAAVLRSATCRSHHLPTRRSKSVCDSSCAKSWASRSATRKTQRPCRHHRHQLASKRGPTAAERPAGDTGPAAAERPGAEPGAERPGRYGARPLRGPAATERPGRYGEARPVRRDPEDLSTSAARVIHHPGCGWHGERR
jgi:hypothetical protein